MLFALWCICGAVQVIITVYLASAFTKKVKATDEYTPYMSIIVAAHNEDLNLQKLVPLLLSQDYNHFEIVIALDRCTDNSSNYLKKLAASSISILEINEVPKDWNPKKYALKQATSKANGEWLVFTDADCAPASNQWLKSVAQCASNDKEIIIGVSPYLSQTSFLSHFIRHEAFMTAFSYVARALKGKPYMAVGRNMAVRRSFFEASPGYDQMKSIQGGDDDLFIQSNATGTNTAVMLGSNSLMFTYPKTTWRSYWNQKVRHLSVGASYKLSDHLFLSSNHLSHLLFVVLATFTTAQYFFLPVFLFYLFIKFVSYRFAAGKMGMNINYILLPLVDILYSVLIPVIALWSKLEKDIKWKN
ncbi:MAG: glycosyltransferase [Ekhidna sp.]